MRNNNERLCKKFYIFNLALKIAQLFLRVALSGSPSFCPISRDEGPDTDPVGSFHVWPYGSGYLKLFSSSTKSKPESTNSSLKYWFIESILCLIQYLIYKYIQGKKFRILTPVTQNNKCGPFILKDFCVLF